jgi:transcriptional regulator with XRE-family HTH domain
MDKHANSLRIRLKALREDKKISQADWAKAAGVAQNQVVRWEKGQGEPGIDSLKGIADFLGTKVAALVGDEAPAFAPPRKPTAEEMALHVLGALGLPGEKLAAISAILNGKAAKSESNEGLLKRIEELEAENKELRQLKDNPPKVTRNPLIYEEEMKSVRADMQKLKESLENRDLPQTKKKG